MLDLNRLNNNARSTASGDKMSAFNAFHFKIISSTLSISTFGDLPGLKHGL